MQTVPGLGICQDFGEIGFVNNTAKFVANLQTTVTEIILHILAI